MVLAFFAGVARAGKLGDTSKAARSSSSSSSTGSSSESSSDGSSTHPANAVDELGAAAVFYVIASPWLLPNALVEAGRAEGAAGRLRFADYPYAHHSTGLLLEAPSPPSPPPGDPDDPDARPPVVFPPVPANLERVRSRKTVAAELGLEAGIGTNDGVIRSGFRAHVLFPSRLGLDTSWSLYQEAHGEGIDRLGRGREHVSLRFAESSGVHFQTGIGAQHVVDSQGWVHGFDATWGFQAFPANPVVFAAEGSLGTIGSAFAPGVRGELGFMLNRFQVSAGFEERWVGPVALGGPFISVTAWL